MRWILLAWPTAAAAAPVTLTHQGRLLDAAGAPLNGPHDLVLALHDAAEGGAALHIEAARVEVQDGTYTVLLGAGGDLDHADLAEALYVSVTVDGAPVGGRVPLSAVPLAAVARQVEPGSPGAARIDGAGQLVLGLRAGETCAPDGALAYDPSVRAVVLCAGGAWTDVGGLRIVEVNGVRRWSDGALGRSCLDYLEPADPARAYVGDTGDGVYRIDPDGAGTAIGSFDVWCDMQTDGGGWTLVHKTNQSSASDRTDSGANLAALRSAAVDAVGVLPVAAIDAISSTYRVITSGRRLYWQGAPYRVSASNQFTGARSIQSKLSWGAAWGTGEHQNAANHGSCVTAPGGFSQPHICIQRWCCNSGSIDGDGIWVNGSGWPATEEDGTGWAR